MRKNLWVVLGIVFCFGFVAQDAVAEWVNMNPGVVGGNLTARRGVAMASVSKDKVFFFGGYNGSWSSDIWLYDDSDNRWTKLSPAFIGGTLNPRSYVGASYIGDDRVIMMGGQYQPGKYHTDTWLYDLNENQMTKLYPAFNGTGWSMRGFHGMAYLGGDKVVMFGGHKDGNIYLKDTWIYDLSDNIWTNMTPVEVGGTLTQRACMKLSYISDGKVIAFGGRDSNYFYNNETWIYDLTANTWTKMTPVINGGALSGRASQGLNYIGSDKVLMFGGEIARSHISEDDTWLYDLSDNTWTLLSSDFGAAPVPRDYHGMAAIGSGKVTIFGGYGANTYLNDTWTYQLSNFGASTVQATSVTGGIEITWSVPSDVTDLSFTVYKNGDPLSPQITTGTPQGSNTVYSYLDTTAAPGTYNRYKVLEHFDIMNSEVFYPEVAVPYCP